MRKFFLFVWEILKVVCISLAIILPVRYYLIQPFYVKGDSMIPNFHDQEYLIVDEISYRFKLPERGQVIVFRYPLDPQEYFIKRIIALPGEQVQFKDGKVIVYNAANPNGLTLDEKYLPVGLATDDENTEKIQVPADEYFVLGDNRGNSKDSRVFGPFDKSFIIGKILFRGWPLNEVTVFNGNYWPKY
jgi:signal peptidase I